VKLTGELKSDIPNKEIQNVALPKQETGTILIQSNSFFSGRIELWK